MARRKIPAWVIWVIGFGLALVTIRAARNVTSCGPDAGPTPTLRDPRPAAAGTEPPRVP